MNLPSVGTQAVIELPALAQLFPALERRGYQVVGPTLRDGAVTYDTLTSLEDLPIGWTDEQGAGQYRLKKREDAALFGYGSARRAGNGSCILRKCASTPWSGKGNPSKC